MQEITRENGLLVKDQDILDLIWPSTLSEIYLLAERVLAIQDAIDSNNILTNAITKTVATIDSIAKETSDFQFRRMVSAIRRGVIEGESYWAGFTTRVLLAEAFSKTPDYFEAIRYFYADLRR